MIAAWMLWSIGVGALFLVAGLTSERLLKGGHRWVWAVAAGGTLVLPVVRFLSSGNGLEGTPPVGAPISLEPLAVTLSQDSALHSLDGALLLGWVVLSSLLVVAALVGGARFIRRRGSWEAGTLLGREVLWSRDSGPAIVGILGSCIVLPAWVRGAGRARQELILAHEEEHLRARDVQLRFFLALLLLAFPWNPALWVQYRRLNLAIELDCDRRVMSRLPDHRRLYGELLLRVAARGGNLSGLAVAALAEQPSLLERRIRQLLRKAPEVRMAQAAFLVFGAILVIGIALVIPGITGEGSSPLDESLAPAAADAEGAELDISSRPMFTPYTVAPDYVNGAEVTRALETEYPPLLRDAGLGGTVIVWFFIDETGEVQKAEVETSSGHGAFDDAALRVAPVFKFTPALNRGQAVPVWISLPITFSTSGSSGSEAAKGEVPEAAGTVMSETEAAETEAAEPDLGSEPGFMPFTVAPDYVNGAEVSRAMEREYPPLLRDAGMGGTVVVWFFIDETGEVQKAEVETSSGHGALDDAALRVAHVFRFTPALNRGQAVPVWISLPITFTTR